MTNYVGRHNMPAYYTLPSARNMPPTPPDYYGNNTKSFAPYYGSAASGSEIMPGYYGHQGFYAAQGRVYGQQLPPSAYSNYRQEHPQSNFREYRAPHTSQLPPLQHPAGQSQYHHGQASKPAQPKPKASEEKTTGGVSATLDYAMDRMVDFVAETAQGMYALYKSQICLADIDIVRSASSGSPVLPQFRTYVSQVLSSTRLPAATIQLALHYLSVRLTQLSTQGRYESRSGQSSLYYMLTIALLLGSKFYDDNTFQNRSWSEVSGIPVSKINSDEIEWLMAIDWKLHVPYDEPEGCKRFETHWRHWSLRKEAELQLESLKLTSLEPSIPQQCSSRAAYHQSHGQYNHHEEVPPAWDASFFEDPFRRHGRPYAEYSPPSAPHTGPNTPEWYSGYYGPGQQYAPQHYSSQGYSSRGHEHPAAISDGTIHSIREHDAMVRSAFKDRPRCECNWCSPQRASFMQTTIHHHDHKFIMGAA